MVDMMSVPFISTHTPTSPLAVLFVAWMATWTGWRDFAESHRLDWTGVGRGEMMVLPATAVGSRISLLVLYSGGHLKK